MAFFTLVTIMTLTITLKPNIDNDINSPIFSHPVNDSFHLDVCY